MNHYEFSNADKLDEGVSNVGGILGFNKLKEKMELEKKKMDEAKAKAEADAKAKAEADAKAKAEQEAKSKVSTTDTTANASTTPTDTKTETTTNADVRLASPDSGKILGMPKGVAIGLGVLILGVGGFLLYKKFKK